MKKIVILFCLPLFCVLAFAQMGTDPSAPVYTDLRMWETQGLISNLPILRPFPAPVLKALLEEVVQKGSPAQSAVAQDYYEQLTGRPVHLVIEADGTVKLDQKGSSTESLLGSVGAAGDISLLKLLSVSYDLKVTAMKNPQRLPEFQYSLHDISSDPARIGPVDAFLNMNAMGAVGTDSVYFQGGISRSSFGNFYDNNVVLTPQAFHTGNFTVQVRQKKWAYSQSLFILGATNNNGTGISPNKYMAMHSITFLPVNWFNITYYENIVFGGRFEPIYLLPFIPFMVGQSIGSYEDNLQMGLAFQFKLVSGLKWNTDIFVDDVSLNDIFKLKFNTKIRIAGQTGLVWAPVDSLCKLLTADYTLVVPYMYSHPQDFIDTKTGNPYFGTGSALNYQNYTTNGMPLGSNLPPNSDRFALSLTLNPVTGLDLKVNASMIRTANSNETIDTKYAKMFLAAPAGAFKTDGGIFNQYRDPASNALPNAQREFGLLNQPTKMYVLQTGLDAAYNLPRYKWGTVTIKFGYTLEFINNYGVHRDIFVGKGHTDNIRTDGVMMPESDWKNSSGGSLQLDDSDVTDAINAWKAALKNVVNHYFRISVKYSF